MEIQGYPQYLIYPDGKVFSKRKNIFLKYLNHSQGYYQVSLCVNYKAKHLFIHRLVAIHYIENPNNYPQVDHIDGNKHNNNIDNLRWVSPIQNYNAFKSIRSDNKTGIKNIRYIISKDAYTYTKIQFGNKFQFYSKSKPLVLWVKFVYELTH